MAFAEALAYGLPVVGTTAGAIPETVPATASLLVPPGDRDALATALRLLLDNAALRARLAAGAAAAGAALPDWPAAVRHWMAALDRLVAWAGSPLPGCPHGRPSTAPRATPPRRNASPLPSRPPPAA